MNPSLQQEERVRALVVEELVVEPHEVTPQARFFHDLGGESIDLLSLQFRLQKDLGAQVDFDRVFAGAELTVDPGGSVAVDSLERLRHRYPFLEFDRLPQRPTPEDLKQLVTIEAICRLVSDSFTQRGGAALPAPS